MAAGVAVSVAVVVLVSVGFAFYFIATVPGFRQADIEPRMRGLPALRTTVAAIYAIAGLGGGWTAVWVRRGRRGMTAAIVLAALAFGLAIGFGQFRWQQLFPLCAYAIGTLLGGWVARGRAR